MTPEEAERAKDNRKGWTDPLAMSYYLDDALATIAAQTWEYAVEVRPDEDSEWLRIGPWWPTVEKARAYRGHAILRLGTPYSHDRVIRRPVGPVEVVE
ncbi:hypothetical protein [Corynebacterium glyciniphilum]|uniref:hypothetical protein n=1 Tax=Corynebacterium glyciniphilum TaxID=1404244 RepID=UPI003FD17C93